MTPQQILTYIREKWQVKPSEMSDSYIYQLMSHKYHSLWQEITLIDENYWSDFWDTNTLATVNQYMFKQPVEKTALNVAEFWQLKIEKITIRYRDTDKYPVIAEKKDRQFMKQPKERYEDNQSIYNPFYIVSGKDIFIYPKPKNTVVNWITMYWVKKPYNLNEFTTNIDDILLEPEYHHIIWLSTLIDVYRERQRTDMAQESESYFEREKEKMIKNISTRSLQPMKWNIPSLKTVDMLSLYNNRY